MKIIFYTLHSYHEIAPEITPTITLKMTILGHEMKKPKIFTKLFCRDLFLVKREKNTFLKRYSSIAFQRYLNETNMINGRRRLKIENSVHIIFERTTIGIELLSSSSGFFVSLNILL